jgi:hypothetical protein
MNMQATNAINENSSIATELPSDCTKDAMAPASSNTTPIRVFETAM